MHEGNTVTVDTSRTNPRRRQDIERKTAAFNLSVESLSVIDRLVQREVFANKSQAVDAALKLLITYYASELEAA